MAKYTIEHAPFTVLHSEDNFQVRHYEQLLLVSAPMDPGRDNSGSAFRLLFNYISGNNSDSREISMTAPVFMDAGRSEKMSFVMPADFTLETTPQPANPNVQVEHISDYTVATVRFNGQLQSPNITEQRLKLVHWLDQQGYRAIGPAVIAGYDPPSALPVLRRNEVLIPIDRASL